MSRAWNLASIRAAEGLALLGDPPDFKGVVLAQVDTGITGHPALGDWVKTASGLNCVAGEPDPRPIDPLNVGALNAGHGTRALSVLCGKSNQLTGVVPGLTAVPYRCTDIVAIGKESHRVAMAKAIRHAIDINGARVIAVSLGFGTMVLSGGLGEAVDHAYENGVILCGAGGQYVASICYPGKYFRAICVGGYRRDKSMYISYGMDGGMNGFADVWAPADPIWRATIEKKDGAVEYTYGDGDGTSYATPQVAASAAMWVAHRKDELAGYPEKWMAVEAFRLCLKRSARNLKAEGFIGFDRMRPCRPDEVPARKGDETGGIYVSGGLDVEALLRCPLPAPGELTRMPPAKNQYL